MFHFELDRTPFVQFGDSVSPNSRIFRPFIKFAYTLYRN